MHPWLVHDVDAPLSLGLARDLLIAGSISHKGWVGWEVVILSKWLVGLKWTSLTPSDEIMSSLYCPECPRYVGTGIQQEFHSDV